MVVGDVTTAVDVLVLGAGPGGYVAAIRSAQLGHHVTLVDQGAPGGTCLKRGCIPLKALLTSTERYRQAAREELELMGISAAPVSFDWPRMQAWKESVVERLTEGVRRLVAGNHIDYMYGVGWFINDTEVRVEGEHGSQRFKFERCVIAVGADAAPCARLAFDGRHILTPEQALALPELPRVLGVYGDDYIALELASIFARLGVKVTLFTPGERILAGFDPAGLRLVQAGLRKLGVRVVSVGGEAGADQLDVRPLAVSHGVLPHTGALHLDATHLECVANGGIRVNSMQQSSVPHIYAVGDCTGGRPLASIAIKQARVAAEAAAGLRVQFAPLVTPLIAHTTPEIASVGYNEEDATQAGYHVVSGRFPFAANGRALTLGVDSGVAMLVASAEDGLLLGATLVGPRASELIGQLTLAIEMGATLTDIAEILYAHPNLGEALQESAESALGKAIHVLTQRQA